MSSAILVLNIGSSSIKFALYRVGNELICLWRGNLDAIGEDSARLLAQDQNGEQFNQAVKAFNHNDALRTLLDWLEELPTDTRLIAAGHRVVHGGTHFNAPILISTEVINGLKVLCPLAPLHQPHNLYGIETLARIRPQLPQVACFDTAFHRTMPELAQLFALPQNITAEGVRRYGFHGLSYEYIADRLPLYPGIKAEGRVIVAHLGHGASLCALLDRRSIATTMSFSPLDGIPMATRSGTIDPGVILYLQQSMGMSVEQVSELLNYRAGLLGLSGKSGDMRELLADTDENARLAVDYFVYQVVRAIGSLAAALDGLDALVFTGGIGEHAVTIRERICLGCNWLGISIDKQANTTQQTLISMPDSKVSAWVIPTNEELVIAQHTLRLVHSLRV